MNYEEKMIELIKSLEIDVVEQLWERLQTEPITKAANILKDITLDRLTELNK